VALCALPGIRGMHPLRVPARAEAESLAIAP